ncbi:MAG: hypothetical protein ACFFC7_26210 [Candidatus Hermodarchaeota archaeon]
MQKAILIGNPLEGFKFQEGLKKDIDKLNEYLNQGWKVVSNAPIGGDTQFSLVIVEKDS